MNRSHHFERQDLGWHGSADFGSILQQPRLLVKRFLSIIAFDIGLLAGGAFLLFKDGLRGRLEERA